MIWKHSGSRNTVMLFQKWNTTEPWLKRLDTILSHYNDIIMSAMASQIPPPIAYSTVYSRRRSKKHQSSASLAFVRGIHRWPVNSSQKGTVTRKMFPFDVVIMDSHRYPQTRPTVADPHLYVTLMVTSIHYSTLGLILPWRVIRDVLRTRPS